MSFIKMFMVRWFSSCHVYAGNVKTYPFHIFQLISAKRHDYYMTITFPGDPTNTFNMYVNETSQVVKLSRGQLIVEQN